MKIRSLLFLSALFVGACCMTSCEEDTGENTDELASIYWNKSAAFRMQLKGKVKSMVDVDSTHFYSFNQSGNLDSDTLNQKMSEYTYSNGKLTRQITNWGEESYADTTVFTYGTSGKYLPLSLYNLVSTGLFGNIATVSTNNRTTRYVASGDSMWMISSYNHHADTISLTFNGGFPVTMRSFYGVAIFTYASDGRFLTVEEVNYLIYNAKSVLTTYKSNSNYLLPISRVRTYENSETVETTTYTYNANEDLIGVFGTNSLGTNSERVYSDYVYDAEGNWTSRKYRIKVGEGAWSEKVTETRTFTYWD